MIIIRKKRIINLLTIVAIGLTYAVIHNMTLEQGTVETVNLPVTNKVIVIDARTSECQMRGQKVVMELVKQKQI